MCRAGCRRPSIRPTTLTPVPSCRPPNGNSVGVGRAERLDVRRLEAGNHVRASPGSTFRSRPPALHVVGGEGLQVLQQLSTVDRRPSAGRPPGASCARIPTAARATRVRSAGARIYKGRGRQAIVTRSSQPSSLRSRHITSSRHATTATRLPHVVQDAVRHHRRDPVARPGHRREHGHLLVVPRAARSGRCRSQDPADAGQSRRRRVQSLARRRAAGRQLRSRSSAIRCSGTSSALRRFSPASRPTCCSAPTSRTTAKRSTDRACSSPAAISRCSVSRQPWAG